MPEENAEKIWQTINDTIQKIINCEVWGFQLTAAYALITANIAKLSKLNPEYDRLKKEWKDNKHKRYSEIIKQEMQELST